MNTKLHKQGHKSAAMLRVARVMALELALVLTLALTAWTTAQAQEAVAFAQLKLDGNCDPKNNKLWVYNNHESRKLVVTVRWNLSGSKRVITDKFQVTPATHREIGCAAQADIVSAEFVEQ